MRVERAGAGAVIVGAVAVVYFRFLRSWHLSWGATAEEASGEVAGRQDNTGDAAVADGPDRRSGIRPDPVLQHDGAGRLAVGRDEHGQRAVQPGPPAHRPDPRGFPGSPPPRRPSRPGPDGPGTVPAMPWPVTSSTASGRTSRQPRSADGAVGLARHLLYDPDLDAESGVLEAGASAGDE